MLILAIDTTSAAGSAALVGDGAVLIEREGDPSRTHGQRLPRELMTLLDTARVRLADVDRFAVAIGPGSFTGLRIGIATMQGLALANEKLIVPVSTFEAFRLQDEATRERTSDLGPRPSTATPLTAVWIDAHRGEVFATLYDAAGRVLHEPSSLTPGATLEAWSESLTGRTVAFAGDGAVKYRSLIEARLGGSAGVPATIPPLAGAIGLIAAREPGRAVRPHAVVPLYVRRSDAELARDRRQAADGQ